MRLSALFFIFFCLLALSLVGAALGFNFLESQRKKNVRGMLRTVDGKTNDEADGPSILRDRSTADRPLEQIVARLTIAEPLALQIQQAGLTWAVSQFLIVSLILACAGFALGWKLNILVYPLLTMPAFAVVAGCLPYLYVRFKRNQRFAAFEEQFPEALDFLARSMRAGHAFSISLEMLGAESPEPLGQEFRTLFNEQNLGAPLEIAFGNMLRRLPLVDVRFFVSSVMLQKQTGGNLSEILLRLAYVIRERFRLKGQVKAASAHGRLTATILTVMPIVLMFALFFVAPGYLQGMAKDPDGKWLIAAAIVAQGLGYFFIRKIIRIKV